MDFTVLGVSDNRPLGLSYFPNRGTQRTLPRGGESRAPVGGFQVKPCEPNRSKTNEELVAPPGATLSLCPRTHDFLPIASTSIPPGDDRSWVDVRPRTCLPPIPWTGPSTPSRSPGPSAERPGTEGVWGLLANC